jgi:hypothetical protein
MASNKISIDPIVIEEPRRVVKPYSWVGHIPFAFYKNLKKSVNCYV